jgi:hypothetical protein
VRPLAGVSAALPAAALLAAAAQGQTEPHTTQKPPLLAWV